MLTLTCLALMTTANPDDVKLASLFQSYLNEEFARHPVFATSMGNHDHDDRLDDLSPAARKFDRRQLETWQKRLIDESAKWQLSTAAQFDQAIWKNAMALSAWQFENDNRFDYDPRVYGEYHTDIFYTMFAQSTLPKARIVASAAQRAKRVPELIDAAKASLKAPPKILTEIAIQRTQGSIAFFEKDIFALAGETAATSELRVPCQKAAAALKDYLNYLKNDLLPKSTGDWRLGRERFAAKFEKDLDAGLTAEEVITIAEAEAERVEREMYTIAKQLWFKHHAGTPLPPDDAAGRRAVVAAVLAKIGAEHGTNETLTNDARATVAKVKEFITAKKILTLPEPDRCRVIEMPEFQRGFSAAYLNPAPPLDANASSLYAVSPPPADWPQARQEAFHQEYNSRMLQILTIHEAYPGHYVQLEYANRNPSMIRKVFASGVYTEGWAVYTEQMMLDQGYGDGDPALRMQQLKFYLRAVLNAILDYHMHCSNWSDAQALALLMGRGFQTEGEAVGKVSRAKQSSCQLSTYFVGRTAFYRLRTAVSRARGDQFNLAAFHEAVMNEGSVPVKYLPQLVK